MENQQDDQYGFPPRQEQPGNRKTISRSVFLGAALALVLLAYLAVNLSQMQDIKNQLEVQAQRTDSLGLLVESLTKEVQGRKEEGTIVVSEEMIDAYEGNLNQEGDPIDQEEVPNESSETTPPAVKETPKAGTSKTTTTSKLTGVLKKGLTLKGVIFDGYIVDPKKEKITFHHARGGAKIKTIQGLKKAMEAEGKELLFATNGGIFKKDLMPEGLYKQGGQEVTKLNLSDGPPNSFTNFYSIPPNGVFFLEQNGTPGICKREEFNVYAGRAFNATQSGPMLLINGEINSEFDANSTSAYIRSGVGVKPTGEVVFIISRTPANFYNFASIFQYYGCKNALYLDGAISELYAPALDRTSTRNEFSTFIAISK